MPATTLDLMQPAIVAAIEAITPRHNVQQRTARWKNYEGAQPPSADSRRFRIEWDTIGYTPNGFIGPAWVDTSVTLTIIVDYGGMPAHVMKRVAEDDHYQLRDVLNRLKSTVDGLRWCEAEDWDFTPGSDPNQAQARHQFFVRYMKARA